MFSSFIVTFREVLEMALIVGVMLAVTKGLEGRGKWVSLGFLAGIAGSAVVAMFTETISNFAEGIGQELFNAMVLFTASLLIGWTAVWMRNHAREMIVKIKEQGKRVVDGDLPKVTLSIIIALAVLREGSEIVLFTYGMIASGKAISTILMGSFAGVTTGAILGAALYFGLVKVPTKYIFQVTTWILLLLTAGMSSMGAKYLVAAGYFESSSNIIWDTSSILSENSIAGQILHALFGYSAQPMAIQAVFYVVTLAFFVSIMYLFRKGGESGKLKHVTV
ncbi:FTR1 family protein [Rickettsiales bacterium]|nr:FTR1 family protein [Rickettsiales bacterium]